jgi:anti-anti-sigma factor
MSVRSPDLPPPSLAATQVLDLGGLTMRSQRAGDTHVLVLCGELDMASARAVEAELTSIEAAAPLARLVIDLRGVTFIDSSGLRLVLEASRRAEAAAHRLALLRPPDRVLRVFQISGIDTLLVFEPVSAEADA